MSTQKKATRQTKTKLSAARRKQLIRKRRQARRQKQALALLILMIIAVSCFVALIRILIPSVAGRLEHNTINAACEAYRSDVQAEARQYGMSDYVDLILALMMQESSGQGTDVLQSSEGSFNTEYPHTPNGITDVDYSIACGIQELKYSMEKAGVTSPSDLAHIELALKGYNFGADSSLSYLAQNNITTWSVESSEAFAEKASGGAVRSEEDPMYITAGPWDYGDQYYPEHVLRYYPLAQS